MISQGRTFNLRDRENAYNSTEYNNAKRIYSYVHQVAAVIEEGGKTILEIGPGAGIVTNMLRQLGFEVTTLDKDLDVNADIHAHLMDMPFSENSFDTVMCCQVLEHLPFSDFPVALRKLQSLSRKSAVISLPDSSHYIDIEVNLPVIGKLKRSINYARKSKMPPQYLDKMGHYWEIGYSPTTEHMIRKKMVDAGWTVKKTWRVHENPWHHFFILNKCKLRTFAVLGATGVKQP